MSSAHSHSHHHLEGGGRIRRPGRAVRRLTLALLIPAAVLTLAGMVLLWPHDQSPPAAADDPTRAFGQVVSVEQAPCPEVELPEGEQPPPGLPTMCGTVTVKVTEGPGAGQTVTTDVPSGPAAVAVATWSRSSAPPRSC
jgi:hypothetical protein